MIKKILLTQMQLSSSFMKMGFQGNMKSNFCSTNSSNEKKEQQNQEQTEQQKQQQKDREEAKERAAKEAQIRVQKKEEKEIEDLKNQYETQNSSFSTASQFYKLIKSKLILGGTGLLAIIFGYQLYDITESNVDPVDGTKKILPINKIYEKKLASSISGIFQGENKIINDNKRLYNKMKKVQQKFNRYEKMNFPVKGNIYLIDRDDFIFFMLPNGDTFVSRRVAFDLKEIELQILMGYQLSHLYMRSSTKNIPFSQFGNILLMKLFDFTELFSQFVPLQEIRQYYTLPLSREQENNNMIMAADILDELGVELDPESLKFYLRDICSYFKKDPNAYILDFYKKHPNLL
ncbi:hypothetical protein ABPG74_017077 [Tetrahymena malaccensis]